MSDNPTDHAIEVIARRAVSDTQEQYGVDWADYPEIGEEDWMRVTERIQALTTEQNPPDEQFDAAYEHLRSRAALPGAG